MTLPALANANHTETIARLNDRARLGLDRTARIVVTRNCLATLGPVEGPVAILNQSRILTAARRCRFAEDCPERDLGSFELDGHTIWVKTDYYDLDCDFGSDDPADASLTTRVITIMLPQDW